MKVTDHDQRVEELQLALSRAFESRKVPAVRLLEDGEDFVLNVSWVVETGRDTTLDSRCSASVRFASHQIDRYAALDTAQRRYAQDRMIERVTSAFGEARGNQPVAGECSLAIHADDQWFDAPPTL